MKCILSHIFYDHWPTASEWHCTLCEKYWHHIFSYDQQGVSDITHFVKSSLITSFPMANSMWVIVHFVKGSLITFYPMANRMWVTWSHEHLRRAVSSHLSNDQQFVSDIAHFVKLGGLITFFLMNKSMWVMLHTCVRLFLQIIFPMTNSEWVTFCILQKAVPSHLFLWPTGSKWHFTFGKSQSYYLFLWPTACEWHKLHILWNTVSSHISNY